MRRNAFRTLAAAAMAMSAQAVTVPPAEAAVGVVGSGSTVSGFTGLSVGGSIYDVNFASTSCAGLFSECTVNAAPFSFMFGNQVSAQVADAVMVDVLAATLLSGETVGGCAFTGAGSVCNYDTPFGVSDGNVLSISTVITQNYDSTTNSFYTSIAFAQDSTGITVDPPFAVWTLESAPVPEPVSLSVFGVGAAGLAVARRRKRQQR
ncbi:MAG: PEP-CTERM sorting domain-containing protein [Acetobacteraceae bacterium]|nr:PEP-CTERM sorting domain-containing protein [Acetobacteraceae bacterium]